MSPLQDFLTKKNEKSKLLSKLFRKRKKKEKEKCTTDFFADRKFFSHLRHGHVFGRAYFIKGYFFAYTPYVDTFFDNFK